jgi:DNA-binding CsgD family transcriptional regulator
MLEDVILSIGAAQFPDTLLAGLRREFDFCRVLIARYRYGQHKVLASRITGSSRPFVQVDASYYQKYIGRNPLQSLMLPCRSGERNIVVLAASTITDREYCDDMYLRPNLSGKIAIFSRRADCSTGIYLYHRGSETELLGAAEALRTLFVPLSAAVERNYELTERTKTGGTSLRVVNSALASIPDARLSVREAEVCCRVALGFSVKDIARQLAISPHTVVTFRRRAFDKLKVHSRRDLADLLEPGPC